MPAALPSRDLDLAGMDAHPDRQPLPVIATEIGDVYWQAYWSTIVTSIWVAPRSPNWRGESRRSA